MNSIDSIIDIYKNKSLDDIFLDPINNKQNLNNSLKVLFDYSIRNSIRPFGPLEELLTDGLDLETIWAEMQTRNKPIIRYFRNTYRNNAKKHNLQIKDNNNNNNNIDNIDNSDNSDNSDDDNNNNSNDNADEDNSENDDDDDDNDEDNSENEMLELDEDKDDYIDSDEEYEDNNEDDTKLLIDNKNKNKNKNDGNDSINDFDEDDMENFLDLNDEIEIKYQRKLEKLEKKGNGHKGLLELDNNEISDDEINDLDNEVNDMFDIQNTLYETDSDDDEDEEDDDNIEDEDDDDNDRVNNKKFNIHYKDFFGTNLKSKSKSNNNNIEEVIFEDDYDDNEIEDDDIDNNNDVKNNEKNKNDNANKISKFEKQNHLLKKQIEELENELITPKSWDMKGEISAKNRPENSLLDVVADVDRNTKPVPIITQQYSMTLEEMIKKRIKDERYDDLTLPKSKISTISATGILGNDNKSTNEYELSQEKSKEGLGDIYANEFMKNTMQYSKSTNELESKKVEIRNLFDNVCRQLDALSHYSFQPKPIVKEAKLHSMNVSSINMEDIMPIFESNSKTFAPEEIYNKKIGRDGILQSQEELTSEDKRRLRRARKASNKKENNMKKREEKIVSKLNPGIGNKYEKEKLLHEIRNDKRVTLSNDNNNNNNKRKYNNGSSNNDTTSTGLFRQLQDEVKHTISDKKKKLKIK